jgi:hypothetical protein|tara:strand:- start:597 stop:749 length:153 start_codon:yes stop_codon:yes gene_type:complete
MMVHHKFSLEDINNMIPWEREIYLVLLHQHVEDENKRNAAGEINPANLTG